MDRNPDWWVYLICYLFGRSDWLEMFDMADDDGMEVVAGSWPIDFNYSTYFDISFYCGKEP